MGSTSDRRLHWEDLTDDGITPYLKGIHLTLESWRPGRDEEGWRLRGKAAVELEEKFRLNPSAYPTQPKMVKAVERLEGDVRALDELTRSTQPPCLLARPQKDAIAALMFGDTSGEGYGSSLWKYGGRIVNTINGIWTRAYGQGHRISGSCPILCCGSSSW
mmetsp:Transcript_39832/g.59083  ORF Transcript_39832/g.59083 Transcript_39832/m.59083 type:complete len:161 (+) Transcript_39832:214-696(+)